MKEMKRVLVCGAGMMGKGVANVLTNREDLEITVYDVRETPFEQELRETFSQLLEKGIVTQEEVEKRLKRVYFTTDLESEHVKETDLVIECVFESLAAKQEIFAKLEERLRQDTIFCTNTSVISPTEIASVLNVKERFLGTHFWNPAFLIPLVEVVKADQTSDDVITVVMEFMRSIGKDPVLCKKDVPGFIANRLQHALWREAIYLVEQGIADAATVDEAVKKSFGLRLPQLGPMENLDMVGTDLTYQIHNYLLKYLCNDGEPSRLLSEKIDNGEIGFKTGKGFQEWSTKEQMESKKQLNEYLINMIYNK